MPGKTMYSMAAGNGKYVIVSSSDWKYEIYAYDANNGELLWEREQKWFHGDHGGHTGTDLQDTGAERNVFGSGCHVSQRNDGIHTPRFGGPDMIDAHFVRLDGVLDQLIPVFAVIISAANSYRCFHVLNVLFQFGFGKGEG